MAERRVTELIGNSRAKDEEIDRLTFEISEANNRLANERASFVGKKIKQQRQFGPSWDEHHSIVATIHAKERENRNLRARIERKKEEARRLRKENLVLRHRRRNSSKSCPLRPLFCPADNPSESK